eukprot:scaffold23014_cov40-Prasinocladus_malaysianus.AAC.1
MSAMNWGSETDKGDGVKWWAGRSQPWLLRLPNSSDSAMRLLAKVSYCLSPPMPKKDAALWQNFDLSADLAANEGLRVNK